MKESFAEQCLEILKREDVKKECKKLFSPVLEFILNEIQPYIYMVLVLIFLIFLLLLIVLVLLLFLLRNKHFLSHT